MRTGENLRAETGNLNPFHERYLRQHEELMRKAAEFAQFERDCARALKVMLAGVAGLFGAWVVWTAMAEFDGKPETGNLKPEFYNVTGGASFPLECAMRSGLPGDASARPLFPAAGTTSARGTAQKGAGLEKPAAVSRCGSDWVGLHGGNYLRTWGQ